jgi:hypothetical protein
VAAAESKCPERDHNENFQQQPAFLITGAASPGAIGRPANQEAARRSAVKMLNAPTPLPAAVHEKPPLATRTFVIS